MTLQREIVDFTVSFERFAPALVDDTVARQREVIPDFLTSETAGDTADVVVRDAAAVGLATALSAIRVPGELPAASPVASAREARLAARHGVPLPALLQSYRVGHASFQEHFLLHAERVGCSLPALRAVTRNLFAYVEWLLPLAEREYVVERERLVAAPDHDRLERVRDVLDGGRGEDLGYPLDGAHIAVVSRAGDVAGALHAFGTHLLEVRTPTGEQWCWLAAAGISEDALIACLRESGATGVGVGRVATARSGFVASHRQAQLACELGARRGPDVCAHRDVALEALAFGGPGAARAFVAAELGALTEDSERVAMLRDTLCVYFAEGGNTPSTARALNIAERTVTYRLRRAEELVGRPLTIRRTELEAALRLHRLFALSG